MGSTPSSGDDLKGFQAVTSWEGHEVLTLADVPPEEGGIVLIGINPSPVSVSVGHYYQGTLGRRMWKRLGAIGLLSNGGQGWEDEVWRDAGNGLSDVVKRPTARASAIAEDEMVAGAEVLRSKLRAWRPGLIVFTFLASARAVHGLSPPAGRGPAVNDVATFRMEGPYASSENVERNGRELLELIGDRR